MASSTSSRSRSRPAAAKRVSRRAAAPVPAPAEPAVTPSPSPAPATPVRSNGRKAAAAPVPTCPSFVSFFHEEFFGFAKHFLSALLPAMVLITAMDHFGVVPRYVEPVVKAQFGEKGQVGALLALLHLFNFVILPLLLESSQAAKNLPECPSLMPGCCHKMFTYQHGAAQLILALVSSILAAVLKQTPYTYIFTKSTQATFFMFLGWGAVFTGCRWWRSFSRTAASIAIFHLFYMALAK